MVILGLVNARVSAFEKLRGLVKTVWRWWGFQLIKEARTSGKRREEEGKLRAGKPSGQSVLNALSTW